MIPSESHHADSTCPGAPITTRIASSASRASCFKPIKKHYRVVILAMIGDYTAWPPIKGRQRELIDGTKAICRDHAAEPGRCLDFQSHSFDVENRTKTAVAQVIADVAPDVAFMLWRHDHHDDHVVASRLSEIALRAAGPPLVEGPVKLPRRAYFFDNGPRHTIGFEPDTFVDVTAEWEPAMDWLGRFMALVRNEPYKPGTRDSAQQLKEKLAAYRGATCGVRYAEAVRAVDAYPRDIL